MKSLLFAWQSSLPRPLLAAILLFPSVALAQTRPDTPAAAAGRQAKAAAKTLAARGDLAAAEQALAALSRAPATGARHRFETALRLTQLAGTLSRTGDITGARAAASRALQLLVAALPLTADPMFKADLQRQIGFINERFLGDEAAAKAAYRSAAQLAPDNPALKEKLRFIEQAEAIQSRRQTGGG